MRLEYVSCCTARSPATFGKSCVHPLAALCADTLTYVRTFGRFEHLLLGAARSSMPLPLSEDMR